MKILHLLPFFILSKDISELPTEIQSGLEIKGAGTDILRSVGEIISQFLILINNTLENAFTLVLKFDFSKILELQVATLKLKDVAMTIIFCILIIFLILKFLKCESLIKHFIGITSALACIAIFGFFITFMNTFRDYGIESARNAFGVQENMTTAEMIYRNATLDLKKSVTTGRETKLNPNVNLMTYSHNASMDRTIIDTKYGAEGKVVSLDKGISILGNTILEEKYYAYKTDYWAVNLTLLVMIIIYGANIYKGAYLIVEGQLLSMIGSVAIAIKSHDIKQIGSTFQSVINNTKSIFLLYLMVMVFSVISVNIMGSHAFDSLGAGAWIVKAVFVFGVGMLSIIGSPSLENAMGTDTGGGFMMKSLFTAHAGTRLGKSAVKNAKNIGKAGIIAGDTGVKAMNGISDIAEQAIHASERRKFNENRDSFVEKAMNGYRTRANTQGDTITNEETGNQALLENGKENTAMMKDSETAYVNENGMTVRSESDPNYNSEHTRKWNAYEQGKHLSEMQEHKYGENQIAKNNMIQKPVQKRRKEDVNEDFEKDNIQLARSKNQGMYKNRNSNMKKQKELPEWWHNQNSVKVEGSDKSEKELIENLERNMQSLRENNTYQPRYKDVESFSNALRKDNVQYTNSSLANMFGEYQKGKRYEEFIKPKQETNYNDYFANRKEIKEQKQQRKKDKGDIGDLDYETFEDFTKGVNK